MWTKLQRIVIRKQEKQQKETGSGQARKEEPDTDRIDWTKRHYALTAEQTGQMLAVAKAKYPSLFIALLLACVTGCRISELLAIRYRDVDYQKKVIYLKAQLGRPVDASALKKGEIASCRIPTKSIKRSAYHPGTGLCPGRNPGKQNTLGTNRNIHAPQYG